MKRKRAWLIVSVLLALVLLMASFGCAPPTEPTPTPEPTPEPPPPETLKIGVETVLSGEAASWGIQAVQAMESWQDEINGEGGLLVDGVRYPVKIVPVDNRGTPEGALASAKKLVYQEEVKFIIGSLNEEWYKPYLPLVSSEGVLTSGYATVPSQIIKPEFPYAFISAGPFDVWRPRQIEWFVENKGVEDMYVLYSDTAISISEEAVLRKAAEDLGLNYAASVYASGVMDFYPVVPQVLETNPDLVWFSTTLLADQYALGAKALRELGYENSIVFGGGPDPSIIEAAGGAPAVEEYYAISWASSRPKDQWTQELTDFHTHIEEEYGTGSWQHLMPYFRQMVEVLALAIQDAGTISDIPAITEAFENVEYSYPYEPERPLITIGGEETYGSKRVVQLPGFMFLCQKGEIVDAIPMPCVIP